MLAAKDSGLLIAGGGHAMAAGLTVAGDRIDALADFLDERLSADVARSRDDRALLLDALLAPGGIAPPMCEALEAGGPYGAGWPAPRVAAGPVSIVKADVVGTNHLRLIAAGDDGRRFKAIAFRMADSPLGRSAALRSAAPQALARRPDEEATNITATSPPNCCSRTPPGPMLDRYRATA